MKTVFYCSKVCKNGKPCSKPIAQVSLIRSNQDAHPHSLQRKTASEWVCAMILDNRGVTINEVAHDMCISHDSAHEIIQD
jgi:hypothetical protein